MTQDELAEKAHLTRPYISLLELGKRTPTITVFIRLIRAVGQSPSDMLQQVEKAMPKKSAYRS